ncbi:hypothetical protein [Hymenobacter algoricola]|uniref:Uncharacterized protein n=1 Tax=Hymenobacter algoricola TaxID=486267 RepID=A0ABP7N1A8_9BACT
MSPSADFIRISNFYVGVFLPASVALPLSIGVYKRVYAQPGLQLVFTYLVVSGVANILASLIAQAHRNNLPLLHIYTIIELLLILAYYDRILTERPLHQLIHVLGVGFSIAAILNFLLLQSIFAFNSYPRALAAIIVMLLGCYYFLTEDDFKSGAQTHKWMNFGLLQYFGSAVFMFAFSNVLYEHTSTQGQYVIGILHATLVLIMYGLVAVGFMGAEKNG